MALAFPTRAAWAWCLTRHSRLHQIELMATGETFKEETVLARTLDLAVVDMVVVVVEEATAVDVDLVVAMEVLEGMDMDTEGAAVKGMGEGMVEDMGEVTVAEEEGAMVAEGDMEIVERDTQEDMAAAAADIYDGPYLVEEEGMVTVATLGSVHLAVQEALEDEVQWVEATIATS